MNLVNLRKGDLVLEIGSGHSPRPESHVLCDKFLHSDEQRGGALKVDRPTVIADGQFLPFQDKQFDYVICCHVLEHVERPELFFAELMRVARRGYIETPSEINEILVPKPYHRWYVNADSGKLFLKPKIKPSSFGNLFDYLFARDESFRTFHILHPELFLTRYYWDESIQYEILSPDENLFHDVSSHEAVSRLVHESPLAMEKAVAKKWLRKVPGMTAIKRILSRK